MENPTSLEIPVWWSPGNGMSYLREGLPPNHPEHPYNYIKDQLGLEPETYGVLHPHTEKYKDYTREQLMSKICELESTLSSLERYF